MDRHSERFSKWQVDLPVSVRIADFVSRANYRFRLSPGASAGLGLLGFVGCGVMVVALANVIAWGL